MQAWRFRRSRRLAAVIAAALASAFLFVIHPAHASGVAMLMSPRKPPMAVKVGRNSDRQGTPRAVDRVLLEGYAWSRCLSPITWAVDLSRLDPAVREREYRNLSGALDQWSAATGLVFAPGELMTTTYVDATRTLSPADGSALPSRSLMFAYLPQSASTLLRGKAYGFGGPNFVMVSRKEIVNGFAVFEAEKFEGEGLASLRLRKNLYLHEIGHALGLGHSTREIDVMFSTVARTVALSDGDARDVTSRPVPCAEELTETSATATAAPSR